MGRNWTQGAPTTIAMATRTLGADPEKACRD